MAEASKAIRAFCVNYCDDIRREIGNKISLIGIYGVDLVVQELPTMIPKLCVYAQIHSELESVFNEDLEVKVFLDDEVIASSVSRPRNVELKPKQFQRIGAQFVLSPFLIEKECTLRARAFYKGHEYKSSGLRIRSEQAPAVDDSQL